MAPIGNKVQRNICVGGKWGDFESKAVPMIQFTSNLLDADPMFVDPDHNDFRLKPESPARKLGFETIPFKKIGLYRSADRPTVAR